MGYSTTTLVDSILAQALTSATNSVVNGNKVPLVGFGNSRDPNTIPDALVNQYIQWADEEVDGMLSEMYQTPLLEKADLEMRLLYDVSEYNSAVELDKAYNLVPGDVVVFFNATQEERHIVDSVTDNTHVEFVDPLVGIWSVSETRVARVKFPPPIALISARFAAASIYDKYFAAQVSPNITEYGKTIRKAGERDINNILQGRTVLHGQRRIGHRFFDPNLRDRYRLPGAYDSDTTRNMDN